MCQNKLLRCVFVALKGRRECVSGSYREMPGGHIKTTQRPEMCPKYRQPCSHDKQCICEGREDMLCKQLSTKMVGLCLQESEQPPSCKNNGTKCEKWSQNVSSPQTHSTTEQRYPTTTPPPTLTTPLPSSKTHPFTKQETFEPGTRLEGGNSYTQTPSITKTAANVLSPGLKGGKGTYIATSAVTRKPLDLGITKSISVREKDDVKLTVFKKLQLNVPAKSFREVIEVLAEKKVIK